MHSCAIHNFKFAPIHNFCSIIDGSPIHNFGLIIYKPWDIIIYNLPWIMDVTRPDL
jgi:hypothetical protein